MDRSGDEGDDRRLRDRSAEEREGIAEWIADRMDGPVTALGIIFVLVVVADTVVAPGSAAHVWFGVASWVLWAVFVGEFVVRAAVAPSTARFFRRNWWQVLFLALPFLRFLRVAGRLGRLRPARLGRVLSSALRGTRTANQKLSGRLGWLSAVTVIVILASSQLLFEYGAADSYGRALHDATFAAITGEPIPTESVVADILEIVLALYSVIVFAFLAGMIGAFLLERAGAPLGGLCDDAARDPEP